MAKVACCLSCLVWTDQQLIKNTGVVLYLLHRQYGFRSLLVGAGDGRPYPSLALIPGVEMEHLPDGCLDSALAFLQERAAGIDLLILHGIYSYTLSVGHCYKRLRPEGKIYLELDPNINYEETILWHTPQFRRFLAECDVIGASCHRMQRYLGQKWPCVIEYLPNGFCNLTGEDLAVDFAKKENIILTVGRIGTPQKNNELLVEAFAGVWRKMPGWELRLVGAVEPGFKKWLQGLLIRQPGLRSKVKLVGLLQDKTALYREYRRAKVFALTSQMEGGTPNVVAEALYGGCYIVTSDIDGSADATGNGACGRVFPLGDRQALAGILMELGAGGIDLQAGGKAALAYGKSNFDWQKLIRRLHYLLYGHG